MKTYIGTKTVKAEPMVLGKFMTAQLSASTYAKILEIRRNLAMSNQEN